MTYWLSHAKLRMMHRIKNHNVKTLKTPPYYAVCGSALMRVLEIERGNQNKDQYYDYMIYHTKLDLVIKLIAKKVTENRVPDETSAFIVSFTAIIGEELQLEKSARESLQTKYIEAKRQQEEEKKEHRNKGIQLFGKGWAQEKLTFALSGNEKNTHSLYLLFDFTRQTLILSSDGHELSMSYPLSDLSVHAQDYARLLENYSKTLAEQTVVASDQSSEKQRQTSAKNPRPIVV